MGVHIWVSRLIKKDEEEDWNGNMRPFYVTGPQDWFDPIRHSGDRDFVLKNDFTYLDSDLEVEERSLARPVDFDLSRAWVKEHVSKGNQGRLLNALDLMEIDESLSFSWSF